MFAREKRWGEKRFGIVHTHGIRQSLSTYLATRVSLGTFGCKRCVFDTKWSIRFCNGGNSAKKLCKTLQECDTSPHVCVSCQQTILGSPVSPISPGNWSCQPRPGLSSIADSQSAYLHRQIYRFVITNFYCCSV